MVVASAAAVRDPPTRMTQAVGDRRGPLLGPGDSGVGGPIAGAGCSNDVRAFIEEDQAVERRPTDGRPIDGDLGTLHADAYAERGHVSASLLEALLYMSARRGVSSIGIMAQAVGQVT